MGKARRTDPITKFADDMFDRRPFVERLVELILGKQRHARLLGVYARWGSGKTSVLNLCRRAAWTPDKPNQTTGYWIEPFPTWQMEGLGDLRVSLLWHLRKHLPSDWVNDESILYRIGRVGLALSLIGANVAGRLIGVGPIASDAIKGLQAADRTLPLGSASASFAAADHAAQVTEAFDQLGSLICEKLKVDTVVVPIDDMDRCRPEEAVSLLFSLKNLLRSDSVRFVVALDRHAIARFLSLTYGEQFSLQDANWFLEKIFDDWVDIPPPSLDQLLRTIEFPKTETRGAEILAAIAKSGLTTLAGNPRRFLRGCQRFERFLREAPSQKRRPDKMTLACFGWCTLYGAFPEQFDALLTARGMGRADSAFETAISVCDAIRQFSAVHADTRAPEKTISEKVKSMVRAIAGVGLTFPLVSAGVDSLSADAHELPQVRESLLLLLPTDLREIAQDYNSGLLRFLGLMSRHKPKELSDALVAVLPYM